VKVLLSARWALLSQTGSLLMKLLPGNLAENVVGDQRFNFSCFNNYTARAQLRTRCGVCHADQVVPLGVAEVLRQQRSRAARWLQLEKNSIGQICCPFVMLI
jgi:hypothetical protein